MKQVAVLMATGFEEIEAIATIDILRRADMQVDMIGLDAMHIRGAHGIEVSMNDVLENVMDKAYHMVFLPGGMPGAKHLKEDPQVIRFLQKHDEIGAWITAICAAPIALHEAGLLEGKNFTCYPSFEEEILPSGTYTGSIVEMDGRIITGRGPAAVFEFAYSLVDALGGDSQPLREGMVYNQLLEEKG
ncbi:DJ-1 family glyoxalase III [Granulicatella seriolae]|uniref:DJ-1/PfpI family protein n=1 Tax=Granulicatella seriolae TaxID=2967226 RepID=A0ABT1WM12_9LACT|nr:DJ-1 family glyoxalase III [Granulicatella seriolae]